MGLGHVPQDPLRAEGPRADVQGRQRRGAAAGGDLGQASLARNARGRWGEDQAARWYVHAGYEIIARNWRHRAGEIDLIVARGNLVVVAEVKTRATDAFGDPTTAVGPAKQARLRRLAAIWLTEADVHHVELRFDVVAITGVRLVVFEAAF